MALLIIELLLCIGFIIIFYHCCVKGARARADPSDNNGLDGNDDLRRFRERMSERNGTGEEGGSGSRQSQQDNSASGIAARKELIEKNLFTREIHRQESVRELVQLLAISRGGGGGEEVDEELGECCVTAPTASSDADELGEGGATSSNSDIKPGMMTAASESSLPEPSAPPPPPTAAATTTDTIATALQTPRPEPQSSSSSNNNIAHPPITLEPIRNLWSNLTHNLTTSERGGEQQQQRGGDAAVHNHQHKLECSICLENYSPNDTIAWAKDGGDPPPSPSSANIAVNNNDMGCEHIFHRGCIVAWLQDHDDCPLCRRKVVHADAEVRFASW